MSKNIDLFNVEFTTKLIVFSLFTPRVLIRKLINVAELFFESSLTH